MTSCVVFRVRARVSQQAQMIRYLTSGKVAEDCPLANDTSIGKRDDINTLSLSLSLFLGLLGKCI